MSDYETNARQFLNDCTAELSIEYMGKRQADWLKDGEKVCVYEVTIKTPRGKMKFDFWNSLYNSKIIGMSFDDWCIKHVGTKPYIGMPNITRYKNQWREEKEKAKPTAYSVLSCLQTYDPGTHQEFCADFGYDPDSRKAMKIYLACQKEWDDLRRIFTYEQLEKLSEIL